MSFANMIPRLRGRKQAVATLPVGRSKTGEIEMGRKKGALID
jgi:hypothetical protein